MMRTIIAVLLLCLVAGCGPGGPKRYEISGKVTYDGRPVPAGQVVFEPDHEQGNSGPAAYAEIDGGRYRTPPGKGHVSGPHRIRIEGYNGKGGGETPWGAALFSVYQPSQDLPKKKSTLDLDVPASEE